MTFAVTTLAGLAGAALLAGTDTLSVNRAARDAHSTETSITDELRAATNGQESGGTFATLSSGHFEIAYASRIPAERMVAVTELLEHSHTRFYRSLQEAGFRLNALSTPLHCRFFDDRDAFDRYAWETERQRLPWIDSYYSPRTNRVAFLLARSTEEESCPTCDRFDTPTFRDLQPVAGHHPGNLRMRIAHEAAHQLAFNSGLQARGVMYPFWVTEGLAASFETDGPLGPGETHPLRRTHLVDAWHADHLRPLNEFLIMVEPDSRSREELNTLYAQAWGIFNFLFVHYPDELRDYLARLAESRPGRRLPSARLRDVTDTLPPLHELREGWHHYLDTLHKTLHDSPPVEERHVDGMKASPAESR